MKRKIWILVLGAALIIQGCGPGDKEGPQVVTEEIDGVTYIHNPAEPLHPEKTVRFEKELAIRGEDDEGNVVLYRPGYFLVDDQGNMYISEMQDMVYKVFDPEGNLVRTIGGQGGGPGEFQSISTSGFSPGGKLLVTDYRALRTSIFDQDGDFLKDFKWTRRFSIMLLVKMDSYVTTEFVMEEGAESSKLFVTELDFDGNVIRSYGEFTMRQLQTLRMGEVTMGIGIPHSPSSIFAGDSERGWLYHCLNSTYRIEVYDAEGRLFRVIDRPYTPLPFTAEDRREYISQFDDNPNPAFKKMVRNTDFPEVKTVTENMKVDAAGNLWVVTQETREEDGTTLTAVDVFDQEGCYDTRVWLEKTPRFFKNGKMYNYETDDESGYRSLVRYNVVWE
ncbi:MAG: hypothetical protein R6V00_03515 [Candidatus Aminicenantes bacterium]